MRTGGQADRRERAAQAGLELDGMLLACECTRGADRERCAPSSIVAVSRTVRPTREVAHKLLLKWSAETGTKTSSLCKLPVLLWCRLWENFCARQGQGRGGRAARSNENENQTRRWEAFVATVPMLTIMRAEQRVDRMSTHPREVGHQQEAVQH